MDGLDDLPASTDFAVPGMVGAVVAKDELILMTLNKTSGMIWIASKSAVARSGGEVAYKVWIIAQITIAQAARRHLALGIKFSHAKNLRLVIWVKISLIRLAGPDQNHHFWMVQYGLVDEAGCPNVPPLTPQSCLKGTRLT
jgi:hypothetical protein